MIHVPQTVMAAWPTPNYVDPVTRGPFLSILVYICFVIVPIVIGARLYSRIVVLKRFGVDDYVFCAAILPIIGFDICCLLAAHQYFLDHHVWDVPPQMFVPATKLIWGGEVLFHLASSLLKISILFFYRRLTLTDVSRKWLNIIRVTIVINILWTIAFTVVMLCACYPLEAFWLHTNPLGYDAPYKCLQQEIYWPLNGSMSVLTDILTVALPMFMIAKMAISSRQKTQLYILFSLGGFAAVAGVWRLVYTIRPLLITYDMFWDAYGLCVASVVELNLGLILASVPALKIYFSKEDFESLASNSEYGSTSKLCTEKTSTQAAHSDSSSHYSEKRTNEADSEPSLRGRALSNDFRELSLSSPYASTFASIPGPTTSTTGRPRPGRTQSEDSVDSVEDGVSSLSGPLSAVRSSFRFSVSSIGMSAGGNSRRSMPPAPLFFGDRGDCPPNHWV